MKVLLFIYLVIGGFVLHFLYNIFHDEEDTEFIDDVNEDGWQCWLKIDLISLAMALTWPIVVSKVLYHSFKSEESETAD